MVGGGAATFLLTCLKFCDACVVGVKNAATAGVVGASTTGVKVVWVK